MKAMLWIAPILACLCGCRSMAPPPRQANLPSAQVLRWMDEANLVHNDQRTVTSPDEIARLQSFFPEMKTPAQSSLHGNWPASIIIRFRSADGIDTYVASDYRIYRLDDGRRGDFVVAGDFSDYIDQLFGAARQ